MIDRKTLVSIRSAALKINAARIRLASRAKPVIKKKSEEKTEKRFKQGWREIGGKRVYFRSLWEANYARYLQWQKENQMIREWEHEPKTFWFEGIKRGVVSYLPDFRVTTLENEHYWVEVKGYWDAKSVTKIKRFKKYFPEESIRIVDSNWYKPNSKKLKNFIPDWEKD